MPITKSASKALRQSRRRYQRNLKIKSKMKSLIKDFKKFVVENKIEEAKKFLPQIVQVIDKTAKRGIIKKNTASRKKSKLAKLLRNLKRET